MPGTISSPSSASSGPRPDSAASCTASPETSQQAQASLDLGFILSFAGNISYPKAQNIRDAAAMVPLDRFFLETDCPYLAPIPYRGKRNEPAYVVETTRHFAQLRNLAPEAAGAARPRKLPPLLPSDGLIDFAFGFGSEFALCFKGVIFSEAGCPTFDALLFARLRWEAARLTSTGFASVFVRDPNLPAETSKTRCRFVPLECCSAPAPSHRACAAPRAPARVPNRCRRNPW